MSIQNKTALPAILMLLCSAGIAVAADQPEKVPNPLENKSVLVQAFLVKVPNKILYDTEAKMLPSDESQSITVLGLAACLARSEEAAVIDTARASVHHGARTQNNFRTTRYVTIQREISATQDAIKGVNYTSYEIGTQFSVKWSTDHPEHVRIEFLYEANLLSDKQTQEDILPTMVSYSQEGRMDLALGRSAIAGSSQNGSESIFLVLLAQAVDNP